MVKKGSNIQIMFLSTFVQTGTENKRVFMGVFLLLSLLAFSPISPFSLIQSSLYICIIVWLALHTGLQRAGRTQQSIRCPWALCYLGSCYAAANMVLVSRQLVQPLPKKLWMVIIRQVQSAGVQEPSKQTRQTLKWICCALDMIWMRDVFEVSHSSDSWDCFFSGWKEESRLHRQPVHVCMRVCLCAPVHLCAEMFCKVSIQRSM